MAKDREIVALALQSGHSPAMAELVLEQQAQRLVIFPLHCIIQVTFFSLLSECSADMSGIEMSHL